MARVTKARGIAVVVDYGLPRSRVASWLAYHIVKLYERDHYATFVRSDVAALLESAGVRVSDDRLAVGGLAQIMVGRRKG
jgi:hypothetical protein